MTDLRACLHLAPLLGLALCLTGCPSSTSDAAAPASARGSAWPAPRSARARTHYDGKSLFLSTCSACHGANALGKPHLGKDLVHSKFVAGLTDAQLLAFVKRGRPVSDPLNTTHVMMPPRGGNPALTDAKITAIIGYLRSIHE